MGDGGVSFYRLPDGGIGGGWHEPGDPGGPPSRDWRPDAGPASANHDWSPDAGISTCPPGWSRDTDGTCDPEFRTDCSPGAEPLPGATCTSTGESDCPSTPYAPTDPGSIGRQVLYVLAGAPATGADGTIDHPFDTLRAALAVASADAWIYLGDGAYAETLTLTTPVNIVGRCAARVALTPTTGPDPAASVGAGGRLAIRGVRITSPAPAIEVHDGGFARLENVRIDGASGIAVVVIDAGSRVEMDSSVIIATRSLGASAPGRGFQVEGGATAAFTRTVVAGSHESGGYAHTPSTAITFTDGVIRDTTLAATGNYGDGLWVESGGSATIARSVFSNNHHAGLIVVNVARATATDVVIRGTLAIRDGTYGTGIQVAGGSTVRATRVLLDGNTGCGAWAANAGTQFVLEDSVVTRQHTSTETAVGVLSGRDAIATVRGVRVSDGEGGGLAAQGGAITVTDTIIRDLHPAPGNEQAVGMIAVVGGSITATRVRIERVVASGLTADGAGTSVRFEQGAVIGTIAGLMGRGQAVTMGGGATMAIASSVIWGTACAGLGNVGGTLTLDDVTIGGVAIVDAEQCGDSLAAVDHGTIDAHRIWIGASPHGYLFSVLGGSIRLTDSVLDGASPDSPRDHDALCAAVAEGSIALDRSLLANAMNVGAYVEDEGSRFTMIDSVIAGVRSDRTGGTGLGIQFRAGASGELIRSLIADTQTVGISAIISNVVMRDSAVRTVSAGQFGALGVGVSLVEGATLDAERLAVSGAREGGLVASNIGTTATLRDVWIENIQPSTRGLGGGFIAFGGAHLDLTRASVSGVSGAAIAADWLDDTSSSGGGSVRLLDGFVHGVRSAQIAYTETPGRVTPTGVSVAYGLHAGRASVLDARHVLLSDGGYGFSAAGASFALRDAVITGQLDAAGAWSTVRPTLTNVASLRNSSDSIREDSALPSLATLPPPTPVCDPRGCM